MSFFSRLFSAERRTRATDSIADPHGFLAEYYGGGNSRTGVQVNERSALRVVAVYACIRVGAETLGSLPLHVYERTSDGGKRRAPEHPLYSLLHDSPNPEMTSLEWREAVQSHVEGAGNGHNQLVYDNAGRLAQIVPLESRRIRQERLRKSGDLVYRYTREDGSERVFPASQIMHVRCFGSSGIEGYSPIRQAREAIAIGMAAEEHWASFFGQGTSSKIVLEHPKLLSPQARKNITESWVQQYTGLANAHRPLIAEEGMKANAIPVNFTDLQFLESRGFTVTEVCRLFRIFAHVIGYMENMTAWGTGIEQMNIAFVIHCILPRLARWEQRMNHQLFSPADRKRYFVEFALDGLLRGDIKSRYEALQIARRNGIISGDDWADKEGFNHFPGGDIRVIESNMTRLEDVGKPLTTAPAKPKEAKSAAEYLEALKPVMAAALGRSLRREAKALGSLAKKSPSERTSALAQFYEEHRTHITEQLSPIVESLHMLRGAKPDKAAVERIATNLSAEHRRLAEEAATAGTLDALAQTWEDDRAEELAATTLEQITANP